MTGYPIKPAIQGKTGYQKERLSERPLVSQDGTSEKEEKNVILEVSKLAHTS